MLNSEIKIRKTLERGVQARKESWRERRTVLRELGFTNEKVISLLSREISVEKVKQNIEDLKKINPDEKWAIKTIEKSLGLGRIDIEKGRTKIKSVNELLESYQFPKISEKEMVEKFPQFVGYDPHRITFSFLILGELSKKLSKEKKLSFAPKAMGIVRDLLCFNPYLVFSVLLEKRPKITEGKRGVPKVEPILVVEARKIEKNDRKRIITEVKENLPQTLENLKESEDPYENEFLLKLAQQLESLEKNKEKTAEKL